MEKVMVIKLITDICKFINVKQFISCIFMCELGVGESNNSYSEFKSS